MNYHDPLEIVGGMYISRLGKNGAHGIFEELPFLDLLASVNRRDFLKRATPAQNKFCIDLAPVPKAA